MDAETTNTASGDSLGFDQLLEATRALLWISTPADARRVAADFVKLLGGEVVPAATAGREVIPIDLSFGDGEPKLPAAPAGSVARMLLERHLPSFAEDVRRALELSARADRLAEDASIDTLTGLPNRRMLGRALGRLQPDDVVIMLDLDHFKTVNDTLGHDAGDRVLRALGRTLHETARGRDMSGRYGGEEFVVILTPGTDPDAFLTRVRTAWEADRPHPVTFSAGIARADADSAATLKAADKALYVAKETGRDRWVWAASTTVGSGAHEGLAEADTSGATAPPATTAMASVEPTVDPGAVEPAFVALSLLRVPEGGQGALDAAFADRLGLVDGWPGFRALEVWTDLADPTQYAMVSWWDSHSAFQAYMQSDDHRRSHDRIPKGSHQPRPVKFRRFRVVAR